jgi:hypothetical protein
LKDVTFIQYGWMRVGRQVTAGERKARQEPGEAFAKAYGRLSAAPKQRAKAAGRAVTAQENRAAFTLAAAGARRASLAALLAGMRDTQLLHTFGVQASPAADMAQ